MLTAQLQKTKSTIVVVLQIYDPSRLGRTYVDSSFPVSSDFSSLQRLTGFRQSPVCYHYVCTDLSRTGRTDSVPHSRTSKIGGSWLRTVPRFVHNAVSSGPVAGALGNIYFEHTTLFFLSASTVHKKSHEGCKIGGGDVEVVPGVSGDCFQLCFTRFLGGPIGGICWVASARNASAMRCGWEFTIDLKPAVSITSVACLETRTLLEYCYLLRILAFATSENCESWITCFYQKVL